MCNDSSEDYLRVKENGSFVDTKDTRVFRTIRTEWGKEDEELVEGSDETTDFATTVVDILGFENAMKKLLGGHTIIDFLYSSAEDNEAGFKRTLGELLLKQNGYVLNGKTGLWEGDGLKITDRKIDGNVDLVREKDGTYTPYTITSAVIRDANAQLHMQYDAEKDKWIRNDDYRDNTLLRFSRTDLKTGSISTYYFDIPLNSIDNTIETKNSDGTVTNMNQEYVHDNLGTIQGATIANGNLDFRLIKHGKYGDSFLANNFSSLAGDEFGMNGMREGISDDPRTLVHHTKNGGSDSCIVSRDIKDAKGNVIETGQDALYRNMNYLKEKFGLHYGYQIKGVMLDGNLNATNGTGTKGSNWTIR